MALVLEGVVVKVRKASRTLAFLTLVPAGSVGAPAPKAGQGEEAAETGGGSSTPGDASGSGATGGGAAGEEAALAGRVAELEAALVKRDEKFKIAKEKMLALKKKHADEQARGSTAP